MAARQFNTGLEVTGGLIVANPTYDYLTPEDLPGDLSTTGPGVLYQASTGADITTTPEGTWTPTFTGLTTVGSPTITGRYTQLGRMVFFSIKIVPGTSTASTAGTTNCDLPITAAQDGTCAAVSQSSITSYGIGSVDGVCYTPTWAATGETIVITGSYEV